MGQSCTTADPALQISFHQCQLHDIVTMMRCIKPMTNELKAQMQEAIAAVKNRKYTAYTAARVFNISKCTLYS